MNEEMKAELKDLEIRIIAELIKNSRRSDREIAKAVGTSQPTVSRRIKELEKKGVIKEYTMIPDFAQLGYSIMGATLLEIEVPRGQEEFQKVRKITTKIEDVDPHSVVTAVSGMGMRKNRLFISFYKDYADYVKTSALSRQIPFVKVDSVDSFLVDLSDKTNYKVLGLSAFAEDLLRRPKQKDER